MISTYACKVVKQSEVVLNTVCMQHVICDFTPDQCVLNTTLHFVERVDAGLYLHVHHSTMHYCTILHSSSKLHKLYIQSSTDTHTHISTITRTAALK